MNIFYASNAASGIFSLDADESRHCLRVLRKNVGDHIDVVDGKGNLYHSEIISDKGKRCELKTISVQKEYGKRNYNVSIAIAPPKNNERFEWFLEKATEIGIDEIYPMITERAERRKVNIERFNKILVSAMKQSVKAYLPVLHEPKKFSDIITSVAKSGELQFIAVCEMDDTAPLKNAYQKGKDALVLVGPEGDFSDAEVKLAIENGFIPVSLGQSRLRIETAGVVACHTINLMNE